ncbi:MAG: hypothetical protein JXD18_14400, partial [Anaerolineae bacterium]|nr:hypothetical protein [Anaerolineae bacterium]
MKKRALCVLLVVGVLALSVGLVAAASGSITTMFAFNNGALGNMFDITAAEDITITGFDINIDTPGASNLVLVYYKQGSYVGSETTAGDWTLLGSATVTSNGEDVPTPLAVGGLTIPAGETYGLFITLDYASYVSLMVYTDGANTYSNSQVTLDLGVG